MRRIWSIIGRKQTSVRSAALILITMVLISRLLGLIRDRMLAARFAPDDLGVYFAAFRLPNLIFEVLVMGALTSAFIPVFTKYITQEREKEARFTASSLINLSILVFVVFALPALLWTAQFSRLLAPGFNGEQIAQMAEFTRFMIVFQVLPLLVGNFFTGILQSYNLFLVPALAPVVYNLGIIIGIVALTSGYGLWAPVAGVAIGAVLFVAIQLPALVSVGYHHQSSLAWRDRGVREVIRLMVPRTIGLAASQVDTTVDQILASLLGARMVTIFNFAQHLQYLPVGLFGATIAQAALPTLSAASIKDDGEQFRKTVTSAIHQILFFVLPVSALFIVLRIPIVRLVFGASRFDWQATVLTGMTLSAFSVSLFAQAISHVLARGFYALYDSRTPLVTSVISIAINTVLSIFFIRVMGLSVWSLGLSTSVASLVNAGLLFVLLNRRAGGFLVKEVLLPPLKMFIAAAITGIALYIPLKLLDQLVFDTTRTVGLLLLTGTAGVSGLSTYFFLSWVFNVGETRSFLALLKKVKRPWSLFVEPGSETVRSGVQENVT